MPFILSDVILVIPLWHYLPVDVDTLTLSDMGRMSPNGERDKAVMTPRPMRSFYY